jgi:hypothetical protein
LAVALSDHVHEGEGRIYTVGKIPLEGRAKIMIHVVIDVMENVRDRSDASVRREGDVLHEAGDALALELLNGDRVQDRMEGIVVDGDLRSQENCRG